MARLLGRLGRFCARHRRAVFEVWAVLILSIGFLGISQGGIFVQQSSLPGTETQLAIDTLRADFPAMTGPAATVVFHSKDDVTPRDWRVALNVGQAIQNLNELDRVSFAENPYGGTGGLKSDDAVVVRVYLKGEMGDVSQADLDAFNLAVEPARQAGLDVRLGGIVAMVLNQPKGGPEEGIGLMMAMIVLLLAFGSFIAAGIPILVSLCGMAVAYSFIHFSASVFELHPTAPMIAAMLSLGAGIDYALFIVTRYRQQLAAGDDVETAIGLAMAHSGHAVVFAGGTVVFAICGLFLSGITFVGRIGLAAAIAVALMVVAALTLLPAVLGAVGTRIDRYKLRWTRPDKESERWTRWGRHVDRRAWPYALGAIGVLLVLAIPTLDLRFGVMADSIAPKSSDARQAYDVVAEEFGPGAYSPFVIVAKVPGDDSDRRSEAAGRRDVPVIGAEGLKGLTGPQTPPAEPEPRPEPQAAPIKGLPAGGEPDEDAVRLGKELHRAIAGTPGVAEASKATVAGRTAVIRVVAEHAPHTEATSDLVHRLRDEVVPKVQAEHPGAKVYLGGENPAIIDLAETVRDRMPIVMAAVVTVAVILLIVAFKSIVVPIKAALMNLLSIGASYGVVTAVFQWGWGAQWVGLDQAVPIMSFVPLFMFALIFGLSMDYEVFLLSRIKEEYDRSGDPHESVVVGIGATARLISAAALIMIFVFISFVPQPDAAVKMTALGLAVAVAIDATIVRLVLVPALMSLLGHANWWFPRWSR